MVLFVQFVKKCEKEQRRGNMTKTPQLFSQKSIYKRKKRYSRYY